MFNPTDDALEVELTTKCTIACPGCPRMKQASSKHVWDYGHADLDLLKRIADTTSFRKYMFVGCYGDPIYHPDFLEICEYFLSKDKIIMINTNGSFRTKAWWESAAKLDWSGVRFLFSIDGLQDTNHLYRVHSSWESIMHGVQTLNDIPADRRPWLVWKYLVFPYNIHQVDEAQELSIELGFDEFSARKSNRIAKNYATDTPELYDWSY